MTIVIIGGDSERSPDRSLAESGLDAPHTDTAVSQTILGEPPTKVGILAALRRSPMVGADLDLHRPLIRGRDIDLMIFQRN